MVYKVVLRRGEVAGYIADCPAIPGCVSQGRTKREALANVKDAMRGCLAVLNERAEREQLRHPAEDVVSIAV
ncbi:MAG: type II toxin-antitoxin system HicB family antitoxin [Candidatus Omnitrophica bacterium]|nr:type II toxin-antitoxin system HicB family antitoxin [Candidatus Omnitrophota bacterium]